jgi:hypothetical protein
VRCAGAAALAAWLMSAAPALASANVSCSIDDRVMALEFEAIAGRTSPINQVHSGIITVKPAAGLKLGSPQVKFGFEQIVQQWMLDSEMRLQIEVNDDTARVSLNLVIVGSLNRRQEKYFGRYVLTVTQNGEPKAFKGRIKECIAG